MRSNRRAQGKKLCVIWPRNKKKKVQVLESFEHTSLLAYRKRLKLTLNAGFSTKYFKYNMLCARKGIGLTTT